MTPVLSPERRKLLVDYFRKELRGSNRAQQSRTVGIIAVEILVDVEVPGVFISEAVAWEIVAECLANPVAKVALPRKKSTIKIGGKFKVRRLTKYPDYTITENARVTGPMGTELKYRWNAGKPYVKIAGKDRSVYWLMVMAGFEEHPAERKARRAANKAAGPYSDLDEAKAEDPETYCTPDELEAR